ncbi:MAG: SH3 domain-containing protein [Phaeodactylibacter sp.]|nr:SH3 domain-containing protein [Phaeodactylibacter sp.]
MKVEWIVFALLAALFLGAGCREKPSGEGAAGERGELLSEGWLEVKRAGFQLREEPGPEGRAIRGLQPGGRARSLGEQSAFTTRLELGGRAYEEPWLLVQMEDGTEGWVYTLAFLDSLYSGLPPEVRLRSLFGAPLAERLALYREAFRQAHTAEAVAQVMSMGRNLRDSLVEVLALRALESNGRENLFWLKEAIPAMTPYLTEDGRTFFLFMDYRPFLPLARTSEGAADDAFLELCLMAFPEDSIEHFYPAWVFQAGEKQAHSLLGRGRHFRILEKLDKLLVHKDLFGEEIGRFRQQLLNDITGADVTYWESKEKASAELDSILNAGFEVLGAEGREALEARRRQFEEPEKYGIRFSYRTGIYE